MFEFQQIHTYVDNFFPKIGKKVGENAAEWEKMH